MHAENLTTPLSPLEHRDEFIGRHLGPNEHVIAGMLAAIGTASLTTLIGETVPASIRLQRPLELPGPMPEKLPRRALSTPQRSPEQPETSAALARFCGLTVSAMASSLSTIPQVPLFALA